MFCFNCIASKAIDVEGKAEADISDGVLNIGLDLRKIIKQTFL